MLERARYSDLPIMIADPSLDWDTEHCRELWANVLVQAIKDAWGVNDSQTNGNRARRREIQDQARKWFMDTRHATGRFEWVCDAVGADPAQIRRFVLARRSRVRINDPTGQRLRAIIEHELQCQRTGATGLPVRKRAST